MKVSAQTIIRTICLVLALINQALTMTGKTVLPIDDEQVAELVTLGMTIAASVWSWWKNNSFTQAALAGDKVMKELKQTEADQAAARKL